MIPLCDKTKGIHVLHKHEKIEGIVAQKRDDKEYKGVGIGLNIIISQMFQLVLKSYFIAGFGAISIVRGERISRPV